jgi:acyl-CoA thioester hydrolase
MNGGADSVTEAGRGGNTPSPTERHGEPFYRFEIIVPAGVVDRNRHVNNVAYVQWMQDAALQHSAATGCTRMTEAIGATWVARMHRIEYLSPGFAGDALTVLTWVADFRKVRSLRRYRFLRAADQKVLAQGETDWVFIDASTGRPRRIPREIANLFELVPDAHFLAVVRS